MTTDGGSMSETGRWRAFQNIVCLVALSLFGTGCVAIPSVMSRDDAPTSKQAPTLALAERGEPSAPSPPAAEAINEKLRAPVQSSSLVWGLAGFRGFATGAQAAPNGVEFKPLFSLDFNFNLWLWHDAGVYGYTDTRFWGQKAAPGITNSSQGAFDFSKREFDLDLGVAWNYTGNFEARAFVYSQNNLNRGTDLARPNGFKDGVGLENRWYVGGSYADLGKPGFDVSRATFLSVGFYPTKELVDAFGTAFKPGPFARAYLTYDLLGESCYLYADVKAIGTKAFVPKLLQCDEGIALRPFADLSHIEFRVGSECRADYQFHELNMTFYGSVRLIY